MKLSSAVLRGAIAALAATVLIGTTGCGGGEAGTIRGQCCMAGLIDSGKLFSANLPGTSPGTSTFTVEYSAGGHFDLRSLLRPSSATSVLWSVDGKPISSMLLPFQSPPSADHVHLFQLSARRSASQPADEFMLILLPAGTSRRFSDWYKQETEDLAWLASLPPVYSSLGPGRSNPEPPNCERRFWQDVHPLASHFHSGGAFEMRSRAVAGRHGHQAIYDSSGNLIRTGPGAGSADKGAPQLWAFGLIKHIEQDVRPFVWAAQLDGNPIEPTWLFRNLSAPLLRQGDHILQYQRVRPALLGASPEVEPGQCIGPGQ